MRAVLSLCVPAILIVSGRAAAAQPPDTVSTATRLETRDKLETLLATSSKTLGFHKWYRSSSEPFNVVAFYDRGLRYATQLEVVMSVTRQNTIGFRVFPHWNWNGPHQPDYIDLDEVRDPAGLMKEALRLSDQNFLFWGMDSSHDLFAGFTVTLEDGFPAGVVRIVLASVPLVDDSVGDLARFAG